MNLVTKKYYELKLNYMQKKIEKEMKKDGFNDDILEKQIQINQQRNKLNLADPNEIINDEGFVQ